jgi:hypothetical protein
MSHPQLRSNKPFPHHRCTRHHHRARRCTPHCPPSQRGQGTIYSHLHPRSARSPSPSRCMSSPYHPRPSIPLPSLCCHNVQIGVHSDLNKTKINCTIVYCGRKITCGHKCTKTGLWMVPLKSSDAQATAPPAVSSKHTHPYAKPTMAIAVNVDATSSAANYARYIHQMLSAISNTDYHHRSHTDTYQEPSTSLHCH